MSIMRLVIGKECDGTPGRKQTIADADAGVVRQTGFNVDFAHLKLHFFQFLDFDIGWNLRKFHREERAFHLAAKHMLQTASRAFVTQNPQMIARLVKWKKERQSLD